MIKLPFYNSLRISTQSFGGSPCPLKKYPARPSVAGFLPGLLPCISILFLTAFSFSARAQDDQLNKVHVPVPPAAATPATGPPAGAEAAPATGADSVKAAPGARLAMNVDLVLVPVTITD